MALCGTFWPELVGPSCSVCGDLCVCGDILVGGTFDSCCWDSVGTSGSVDETCSLIVVAFD